MTAYEAPPPGERGYGSITRAAPAGEQRRAPYRRG